MSRLERIDELTAPPVVGRAYLVPTVLGRWSDRTAAWPVMGPLHDDRAFFNFEVDHYHLDRRFLTRESDVYWSTSRPLHCRPAEGVHTLPAPVLRRRKCRRADMHFPTERPIIRAMQAHLAGAQCARSPGGWVCPHRRFDLATIAPDARGIITCPLHGLQVDAGSGRVIEAAP